MRNTHTSYKYFDVRLEQRILMVKTFLTNLSLILILTF